MQQEPNEDKIKNISAAHSNDSDDNITVPRATDNSKVDNEDTGLPVPRMVHRVSAPPLTIALTNAESKSSTKSDFLSKLRHSSHFNMLDHCHRHRGEGVDKAARKKLFTASIICLLFMCAEITGGILANSLAIAADAAHLLTDFTSFMISLFAIQLAGKKSTQRMSFGWHRAEVIGAMISVFMIWVVTGVLVWYAIERIISNNFEINADIMLITSGLAILINVIMGIYLLSGHSADHGHSHSVRHSHTIHSPAAPVRHLSVMKIKSNHSSREDYEVIEYTMDSSTGRMRQEPKTSLFRRIKDKLSHKPHEDHSHGTEQPAIKSHEHHHQFENMNVRAAFIHVVGDGLQSVGVFIAAIIIYFRPDWHIADPICTFLFCIIVIVTTLTILKDAFLILMESTPSHLDYAEILEVFQKIEGVRQVHNLRIWALSLNKVALSVHLAIDKGKDPQQILNTATRMVHLQYDLYETTIQIEEFKNAMEDYEQCEIPPA